MTRTEALVAFASLDTSALYAEMQRCGISSPDFDAACKWSEKVCDRIAKTSAATLSVMTDWRQVLDHASGKDKAQRAADDLPADIVGTWYDVEFNGPADRVQIIFRRFPPAEARQIVKDAGFYWSPALKCWQRRITKKAERAAYDASCKLAALHLH